MPTMRITDFFRPLIFVCFAAGILANQCSVVPKCTCTIGDEEIEVAEQYTGSEALTGTVGALGSMVVTGGGLGLWYYIKRRKMNSVSSDTLSRSDSDVSTSRDRNRYGGKEFNSRSRPPNIYTAGRKDNFFPKVGVRNNLDI